MDLIALAARSAHVEADYHRWIAPYDRYREDSIPRLDQGGFTAQDLAREETALLARLRGEPAWREIEGFLTGLCREFWSATTQEAQALRALLRPARGIRWALLDIAASCGVSSAGRAGEDRLRLGVAAVALEDFTVDHRDSLIALADLYVGAEAAGVDPEPWLQGAARLSGVEVATALAGFATSAVLIERRQTPVDP